MDCMSLLGLADPTEGSLVDLAARYRAAREWARDFSEIADAIELELAPRMEDDTVAVDGVGTLVRTLEKRTAWKDRHASAEFRRYVADMVVREIALDVASGELEPVKRNVATATVDLMLDVLPAFSSVKARGRQLGIDTEDFRSTSEFYRVGIEL